MSLTVEQSQASLVEQILATELSYGELACGPNFLLDIKLFSHSSHPKAVSGVYKLVKSIYKETPLEESHLESLLSTIDRDAHSESWDAKDNIKELTSEAFSQWLTDCCLSAEHFVTEEADESVGNLPSCEQHQETIAQLIEYVKPLVFEDSESIKLYTLTDSNNENTPYSVYVAIGKTHTLLVVSHWIL